jgi:hypothetical protein
VTHVELAFVVNIITVHGFSTMKNNTLLARKKQDSSMISQSQSFSSEAPVLDTIWQNN